MTLPRKFRQLRIGLIGFGDVARRLLMQRLATATAGSALHSRHNTHSAHSTRNAHGPNWIAVSRSGPQQCSDQEKAIAARCGVRFLRWDLDQKRTLRRLAPLLHACVVLAPPAEHGTRDQRMRRFSLALMRKNTFTAGVYLSTTGVYGDHQGQEVTEVSRCTPTAPRSQRRRDAEQVLRHRVGFHVLRVPGIYGHDRLPLARLASQQPALKAEDDVFTNHIHADDLARIAWAALFRGQRARVTNAVDQTQMKMADYFDAVADAKGLPRPPRISKAEMLALGKAGAVNPMMLSFLAESRRVRSRRLAQELRIQLRYPTVHHTLASA
jgi:nucleoside-diphosphate-sugar epimerase